MHVSELPYGREESLLLFMPKEAAHQTLSFAVSTFVLLLFINRRKFGEKKKTATWICGENTPVCSSAGRH